MESKLIAARDPQLCNWIFGIRNSRPNEPGGFLLAIADAAARADSENYELLRPVLLTLQAKYPDYHDPDVEAI